MKQFLRFIRTAAFWTHFGLIVLFTFLLALLFIWGLSVYTNHGDSITVPNLKGMALTDVEKLLSDQSLDFTIIDSSFVATEPPEVVLGQYPDPGEKVKENRKLYLTVNAKTAPKVKLPDIIDASHRNAEQQLLSYGLLIGNIEYRPDIADGAVLAVKINGTEIKPGTEIAKGTRVDLVLGKGDNSRVTVPELVGLTFEAAKTTIMGYNLLLGKVNQIDRISDKESALVERQSPPTGSLVAVGEPVELWIRDNPDAYNTFDTLTLIPTPPASNGNAAPATNNKTPGSANNKTPIAKDTTNKK
ncbi:MAG: PASTA domain-containing protein [Sphingobacteriales bacterium]|jgi:beta-lactam-binding protein with PASTA domain|nr:PASTA domain-containing protein [Sphingobacteriales bacterium]MBP9141390.1 PASTA domain-containing protein [Chitinophagales bacterium]MDA0198106.1 PASTA domain-containing protein [Bacteroidota bacterium]MBK7527319.1 PASTA domain-containing protein [Sphingobacteriales bacterium]MBK8678334.1 PASTA domain-containing protein [Sphingobacteriales bacterium]